MAICFVSIFRDLIQLTGGSGCRSSCCQIEGIGRAITMLEAKNKNIAPAVIARRKKFCWIIVPLTVLWRLEMP
jgi:hypothetical protein